MDYQAVITSYSNKRIDIEKFKKDLEIARPLKQRQKYRAVEMSEFWRIFNANRGINSIWSDRKKKDRRP